MDSCFDGKADFYVILWFYQECYPPLYFRHRLKMKGGNGCPSIGSSAFSGHEDGGRTVFMTRVLCIFLFGLVALCAVTDGKKAAVYFWCNAVREYPAVFRINHTFCPDSCEAVPGLLALVQCQSVLLSGYGMCCLYCFTIAGSTSGKMLRSDGD